MRAEISYFSPAEFGILMALTGTTPYCAVSGGPPCTLEDYRRAYGSLYQRGYLERTDSGFALADLGNPFRQIRAAQRVLVLTAGDAGGAPKLYYWNGSSGWLVEWEDGVLSPWYRVQEMSREPFAAWLRDADLLERPMIPPETADLMRVYCAEALQAPAGECVFRLACLEQGQLIRTYELRHCQGVSLLCSICGDNTIAEIYTEDSARRMLDGCLEGKLP